jgi:hypothetical protein
MKNIYFSLSNIYYYSTIIVFSIFTTFSTVFFHKYIFVNINILIFLVFLYFNILVLILFCLRKKNYSVINFIAFFFIFLFIFEIYLYNKNYESQSISKLKNYQMNDKIENYLKIVYPRYILEMQSNYNIDNSDYFYLFSRLQNKLRLYL